MPGMQGIQGDMGRPGEKGARGAAGPDVSNTFTHNLYTQKVMVNILPNFSSGLSENYNFLVIMPPSWRVRVALGCYV